MTLGPNFLGVAARWLHLQRYGVTGSRICRSPCDCPWMVTEAEKGSLNGIAKEAVRWDGPVMREEVERVFDKRLPRQRRCWKEHPEGYSEFCYHVTSILWHHTTPHTAEDSWMALLDDGRVGLVARLPKVAGWKRCFDCRGSCFRERHGGPWRCQQCVRMLDADTVSPDCRPGFLGTFVDPKPARITGIFPDADSALASLPAVYFTEETCADVRARWEARPRVAVEVSPLLEATR